MRNQASQVSNLVAGSQDGQGEGLPPSPSPVRLLLASPFGRLRRSLLRLVLTPSSGALDSLRRHFPSRTWRSSHTIALADFRGRALIINFWASWCIPCRTEMPLLERAHRAASGQVQFLGIDSNDTSSAAVPFLNQVHVTYPVGSDIGGSVATDYGLFGLPTTVFISPSGKVVGRIIGQLHAYTLRNALKEAFHVQIHS
jgi:thiol-disulfide isomerase/thioredoxin